ncbi:MAG: hypothetical protein ACO3DT_08665 [Gammaproteobacteria bacterium]
MGDSQRAALFHNQVRTGFSGAFTVCGMVVRLSAFRFHRHEQAHQGPVVYGSELEAAPGLLFFVPWPAARRDCGARDGQGTKNILGGKETAALEYMEVGVRVAPGAQTGLRRPGNKKLQGWCRLSQLVGEVKNISVMWRNDLGEDRYFLVRAFLIYVKLSVAPTRQNL